MAWFYSEASLFSLWMLGAEEFKFYFSHNLMKVWRQRRQDKVFLSLSPVQYVIWQQGARRCGNGRGRLHFADTQACAFMPRPIKMALSACYLLGLAVAVQGD